MVHISLGGEGRYSIRFPCTRTVIQFEDAALWSSSRSNQKFTSFSDKSTPAVPDSFFHATESILDAGIIVIQPSTGKIVMVWDGGKRLFLLKGRKDRSESLD